MADIKILGQPEQSETRKSEQGETSGKKSGKLLKTLKKKPFLIAVIVVVVIALYVWYKSAHTATTQSSTETIIPDAYTGYPPVYTGGSSGAGGSSATSDTSYIESVIDSMKSSYDEQLAEMQTDYSERLANIESGYSDKLDSLESSYNKQLSGLESSFDSRLDSIQQSYDNTNESLLSQLEKLSEKFNTAEDTLQKQASTIERMQDIDTMKSNSDAYFFATSDARKQALHNANVSIASKYGFIYDEQSGGWYDENGINRLYVSSTQDAMQNKAETTPKKTSSSNSSAPKYTWSYSGSANKGNAVTIPSKTPGGSGTVVSGNVTVVGSTNNPAFTITPTKR